MDLSRLSRHGTETSSAVVTCLCALTGGLLMMLAAIVHATALELRPDQVKQDLGHEAVEITVLEPHAKCGEVDCTVTYVGIPLGKLLQHYFPGTWEGFSGKIGFFARDGYFATIDADRVRKQDGYLTFARADGKPFVLDNGQQGEPGRPLGPFYLVWDNLQNEVLQQQGGYSWPYQVVRIALLPASLFDKLLPAGASPAVREGFRACITYCLTCHQIDAIGGTKVTTDLRQLVSGKSRDVLRTWISDPGKLRSGTGMPPLNPDLGKEEREQVIDRLLDYLESL